MPHIAIVGGGPAGYVAAIRARQLGADVTLVEEDVSNIQFLLSIESSVHVFNDRYFIF